MCVLIFLTLLPLLKAQALALSSLHIAKQVVRSVYDRLPFYTSAIIRVVKVVSTVMLPNLVEKKSLYVATYLQGCLSEHDDIFYTVQVRQAVRVEPSCVLAANPLIMHEYISKATEQTLDLVTCSK